ncbi:Unknown protein [Striga hermonthica]|uniref:DUF7894 domain-containing protein n=1 Tax=Striga hermonthica TaxID=68872 RepID=A0A9N7NQN4_STRHE|nr:Unknown protein [Striga hermonthica]
MKVAEKVILLLDGGDALSAAVSSGLNPIPSSNFKMLKEYFGLPLDAYGIKDQKASGEIIHSVNPSGDYEVSIVLLQSYEPPILACALNEVLLKLAGDDLSCTPTLIVPCVVLESKLKQENKYSVGSDNASVYGIELGPKRDLTEALSSKLQKPSPFLQVYREDLATLLHLLTAMKLPALVLIGQSCQRVASKNSKDELEVICQIGDHLASFSGLLFSKDKTVQNPPKKSRDNKEAWQALRSTSLTILKITTSNLHSIHSDSPVAAKSYANLAVPLNFGSVFLCIVAIAFYTIESCQNGSEIPLASAFSPRKRQQFTVTVESPYMVTAVELILLRMSHYFNLLRLDTTVKKPSSNQPIFDEIKKAVKEHMSSFCF